MIMVMESDIERICTLLRELHEFTGWAEPHYLLTRLERAKYGYPLEIVTTLPPDHVSVSNALTQQRTHAHNEGDTNLKKPRGQGGDRGEYIVPSIVGAAEIWPPVEPPPETINVVQDMMRRTISEVTGGPGVLSKDPEAPRG